MQAKELIIDLTWEELEGIIRNFYLENQPELTLVRMIPTTGDLPIVPNPIDKPVITLICDKAQLTKQQMDKLEQQLQATLAKWEMKSYVQNSDWTEVNEGRRAKNIDTISSLLEWYQTRGTWSEKQVALVRKLINNGRSI